MEITGSRYEGDMKNGRCVLCFPSPAAHRGRASMEGQGTYTLPSGVRYVGAMVDGEFHGEGTLHFPNGGTFSATWIHGKAVGKVSSGVRAFCAGRVGGWQLGVVFRSSAGAAGAYAGPIRL